MTFETYLAPDILKIVHYDILKRSAGGPLSQGMSNGPTDGPEHGKGSNMAGSKHVEGIDDVGSAFKRDPHRTKV